MCPSLLQGSGLVEAANGALCMFVCLKYTLEGPLPSCRFALASCCSEATDVCAMHTYVLIIPYLKRTQPSYESLETLAPAYLP